MLESTPTVGSIETSTAERRRLALASHAFNRKTPLFLELFPELVVQPAEGEADDDDARADDGSGAANTWMGISPLTVLAAAAVVVGLAVLAQQL